jgi:hypothetical protein
MWDSESRAAVEGLPMKTATSTTNIASALAAATAPTGKAHPLLAGIPAPTAIAERIANRIATEIPTLAAKVDQSIVTAAINEFLATAAERGPDWIALYDCTPWCALDHAGADGQPGWHQGPIVKAIAPVPNVNALPGEDADSFFEARVTQTRAEAAVWGIESKIWLDYGRDTLELDVAGTDRFIASTEAFLLKLRVLRDQLALVSRDDFPGDEEAKAAYRAAEDARIKAISAAKAAR